MEEKRLVTRAEAQRMLKIGKSTMLKLIHQKKIPAHRVGRKFLIDVGAIDSYLECNKY